MKNFLLDIAKKAIESEFDKSIIIDSKSLIEQYPILDKPCATFVTLTLNGHLRGCIGSLIAHRTLLNDLVHNARSAAFEDPRFEPLSYDEFKIVDVEVSLLTEPVEIKYSDTYDLKSKVQKGVDGIIIKDGGYQATFLPQVWESLPTFEAFFQALCQKAGLSGNCLDIKPQIFKYNVEKIS
ncbi:AmmeMemoRadiSam system protein A [Arcobacter sp. FWKO B]|uniref:AmmeMemoRadiSam system protein A n=1 Tax=Arcobacter sp. FWKO B TaxID=2593672 RepID=UPI0018A49351|nr:AmmeMemoRadiSam system protein A [Arcobacter sp. FWKO B]QOG12521.1 AmmeMemoRadiSam system protein A [Arcobacter sp. FWKO B]